MMTQPARLYPIGSADDPYLSMKEAARYLGVSQWWLRQQRATARGPAYYRKSPKKISYRRSDLDRFMQSCRITG